MTDVRERLGFLTGALVAVLAFVLLAVAAGTPADGPSPLARAGIPAGPDDTNMDDPGLEEEREEQAEGVEHRVEAWEEAMREGRAGQDGKRTYLKPAAAPAVAWVGEVPIDPVADDWEPAIAADAAAPYVYVLVTRYGSAKPCPGLCPTPYIALAISSDGGATWAPSKPLCACKGSGQFDPIIEVVLGTGAVYALYMPTGRRQ